MKSLFRLFLLFMLWLTPTSHAGVELGAVFTDHMVLQSDMPVPVWGKAEPNASVTVSFAGEERTAVAGTDGKWMLELSPLSASFVSRVMTVTSSHAAAAPTVLSDVLVGEVWICSGQSNMQTGVSGVPETKALVSDAQNIRSFTVEQTGAFTEQDTCGGEWIDSYPNSAVAFGFAHFLQQKADVPIGIILTCWGSSSLEAWMPRDMTETVPHFKTMMAEFDADEEVRERVQSIIDGPHPRSREDDVFLRRQSNLLYNAMMAPLAPYGVRGIVWYQGERNAQSLHGMVKEPWFSRNSGMLKYGDVLKEWMQRYREEWGRVDLEFMVVMLPGYYKPLPTGPQTGAESPIAHSWAWMRESQLQAVELPHTAVVNTIDLGDEKNIHPKDKLPVGERLALLAARNTLGMTIEADGPIFRDVVATANSLVVTFDHAEGLTTVDGNSPTGFWIADGSAEWVPAKAKIEGESVVLSSNEIGAPRFVRYAFAGKPTVNLVNGAGLPAYPFRSDEFEP